MSVKEKNSVDAISFEDLGLPETLLDAVKSLGYTIPTPIQAQAIPALLSGSDVLGQAQTGTGKTAAFALPLLAQIQVKRRAPQILVLVPTRELALQVAEAFIGFASNMPELNILPIYGGQGYNTQLSALRKGAHIVIGTPGRVMDHMRRGTLELEFLKTLILDEADEMLRMGFAEDVEWILEQCPAKRQTGLFSATMPAAIKSIAERYLDKPQKITVQSTTTTASTIKQFYWQVSNINKLDALSRILETEESDAVIIFVRTKRATEEVAAQLDARGFNAVAINGDIVQQQRERVIEQLKSGRLKILVATDVAARGIDVDRITHVINYDIPHNTESYVHRIGRTGRAGRQGKAILFVSPRDKYMLRDIERVTKQEMQAFEAPSAKEVNARRIAAFKQRITDATLKDTSFFENLIEEYVTETNTPALKVAATLATIMQGTQEFLLKKSDIVVNTKVDRGSDRRSERSGRRSERSERGERSERSERSERNERSSSRSGDRKFERDTDRKPERRNSDRKRGSVETDMEQYRIDIGREHGIQPKNLVGAIANTAGIEGRYIGKIKIEPKFTLVDLPKGMPRDVLQSLQRLKISGKLMNLRKVGR
jgi:ATP-dependent RNA helicase DeaD